MKKVISLMLAIMMLLSVTAGLDYSSYALSNSGRCGSNVRWTWDPSGNLRISGSGPMYDYYTGQNPFDEDNAFGVITDIVIDYGVTSIGKNIFNDCYHLESVTIPNSVTSIGESAFYNCNNLKNVKIPNSVTTMGRYDFKNCTELISVQIPHSLTTLGIGTFNNCPKLKHVYYTGTTTEWKAIDKDGSSNIFYSPTEATITYNYKCASHIYDDGTVTRQPTCTETGVKRYNCIFCKKYKQPSVSALGHDYQYSVEIKPTCYEEGLGKYTCSRCGDTYSESIPPYEHHKYDRGTVTTEPTCTRSGILTYKCNGCSASYNETIPALNHNYVARVTRAATCNNNGIKTYTCSRCGASYTQTIKALGHKYVTTIEKATPDDYGCSYTECSRCGDYHYKEISSVYAKLSKTEYKYDGKAKKPKVTVYNDYGQKLSSDFYKVIYPKGRKKVGKYTIKIVLRGAYYSGTIKKTFKIKNGKKVKTVKKPAQVKGVVSKTIVDNYYEEVKSTAKWKKVKGASGYQIKLGDMEGSSKVYWYKTVNKKGASNTTYKTYCTYGTDEGYSHIKVRAYKVVNGKKVYGKWSKVVKDKIVYVY